jgi:hypothetical protein
VQRTAGSQTPAISLTYVFAERTEPAIETGAVGHSAWLRYDRGRHATGAALWSAPLLQVTVRHRNHHAHHLLPAALSLHHERA